MTIETFCVCCKGAVNNVECEYYALENVRNFQCSCYGDAIEQHIQDWEELRDYERAVIKEDSTTDLAGLLDTALWGQVFA